jgi:hypothetical protein
MRLEKSKKAGNKSVLTFFFLLSSFLSSVVSAQTADSFNSAISVADESRKRAGDFEGNAYFPGEWEAAESRYAEAGSLTINADAITAYNEAAAAFDSLFELAIPLYAQAREDEIMAIRGYLIELGARGKFSEYLLDAEKAALLAFDQYEAKDYYAARDSAANALQKFNVLGTAFNAWLLRVELLGRGFEGYDLEDFDIGNEEIVEAMGAYMDGDLETAHYKAERALSKYDMVLSTAWFYYAELRSSLAEGERLAALDMKTDIAAKDFFRMADSDNKTALDLMESKNYEDAAKLFINAEAMFVIASMTTLEKRRTAAAAIKHANEKIHESDIIARNAELFIEGGSK